MLESECQQLVRYFDNSEIGQLNFDDFLQILLPCESVELRTLLLRKQNLLSHAGFLDFNIEKELSMLVYKEILFARQLETLKMQLHSDKAFDIGLAFTQIDDWKYGYID